MRARALNNGRTASNTTPPPPPPPPRFPAPPSLLRFGWGFNIFQHPHVGRESRHTHYPKRVRRMLQVRAEFENPVVVRNGVFLPSALAQHPVAHGMAGMI